MKRHALFALAFAVIAACETPTSAPMPREPSVAGPSFAVVFNQQRLPFAFDVVSPCNGDRVSLEGLFHIVIRETFDASGGSHFGFRLSAHGGGVGVPSGATYVWNDVFGDHLNFNSSGAENTTFTSSTLLVAKGNVPNFQLKILFHFTINANGEMTSFKFEFSPECRG